MKRILLIAALAVVALPVYAANLWSFDDSGNLVISGGVTADSLTITQEWTQTNGETIDNASDGIVRITYDDNAATLGQLKLESDNAGGDMDAGDSFLISGIAHDSGGGDTTYGEIDFDATAVTAGSEEGQILFKLADPANSGTLTTFFTVTEAGTSYENGEIIGNLTDAELEVVFDDDAAELGKLTLRSSVDGVAAIADNDYVKLSFAAEDHAAQETEWAFIEMKIVDESDSSETGGIDFNVMVGGSPTDVLQLSSTTATVPGILAVSGAANITGIITGSAAMDVDSVTVDVSGVGVDVQAAGALRIGAATATSVEIADSTYETDIQGTLSVDEAATFDALVTASAGVVAIEVLDLDTSDSPIALSAADCKGGYHFNDDNDALQYTLPAVVAGMSVTIGGSDVASTSVITIEVDASDKIVLDGTLLDAGDTIDSGGTAGECITLIGLDSVRWFTIIHRGTWVDGGAT